MGAFDDIKTGFGWRFIRSLSVHAVILLLSYSVHVGLARAMGAAEYGVYAYAFSWLSMISIFGTLGFELVEQRFVPDHIQRGEWAHVHGVLLRSFQIPGLFSLLLAAVFAFACRQLVPADDHLLQTLQYGALLIPLLVWLRILQGGFIALRRPVFAQLPEGVFQPVVLLAVIGSLSVWSASAITAPFLIVLVVMISAGIAVSATIVFIKRALPAEVIRAGVAETQLGRWMSVALPALAISGMHLVIAYTDTIMIGLILDTTDAGIYSVASKLSALVAVSLTMVNLIVVPYISQLYYAGDIPGLQKTVSLAARLSGLFVLPLFPVLWFFGGDILGVFGEAFVNGQSALEILMIGQLVNVLAGSVGFLLMLTGNQWRALVIMSAAALLNFILNLVLIRLYGIDGAAVSTMVAMVLWNLSLVACVRSRIGINPTFFSFR